MSLIGFRSYRDMGIKLYVTYWIQVMTENNGFMPINNQSTRQLKPKKLKYC